MEEKGRIRKQSRLIDVYVNVNLQSAILAVLLRKVLQINMPANMAVVKIRASVLKRALARAGPGQ
jgi:hypothetical protein